MTYQELVAAMAYNEPVKLDSVYVNGTGGSSNMYFVPKGTKVYCSHYDDDFYITLKHAISFGWEYKPNYESDYTVHTWESDSIDDLLEMVEEIFSCWKDYYL